MEKKAWYEYNDKERTQIYGKFTIKEFWDWWSDNEPHWMEIRINDFNIIKETANKFNLPYSVSGVYVRTHYLLKAVIGYIRNKATCWFGINPRKYNFNKFCKKTLGGKDEFISEIGFIFIDIDRLRKTGRPATQEELKNADKLANLILLALQHEDKKSGKLNWAKSYCKLCSGNGVQLLIKLDVFLKMPDLIFNSGTKLYEINPLFEQEKNIIKYGFGVQLKKYAKTFKKELGVVVDDSVFNIGRIGALPFTKNYKYGGFTWRGILELENGENSGLSSYIDSIYEEDTTKQRINIFVQTKGLQNKERISSIKKLEEHPLTQLLLSKSLIKGEGSVNNKLWLMLKCLIRDNKSNIDITNKKFLNLVKKLEKNYGNILTLNFPSETFKYSPHPVNAYCRDNLIPPITKMWPNRTLFKERMGDYKFDKAYMPMAQMSVIKYDVTHPLEACEKFKKKCLSDLDIYSNEVKIARFTAGLIEQFGEKVAKYYDKYVYVRLFNYDNVLQRGGDKKGYY